MLDATEMITFTEKLIEEIKNFSVLYDRKVMRGKDNVEKEEAWISLTDRLPANLKVTVDDTKKRWRTLKDCYSKYLRSGRSSNRFEARYRSWRWSGHMDFFKSYMLHSDSFDGDQSSPLNPKLKRKYDKGTKESRSHLNKRVKRQITENVKVEVLKNNASGYKKPFLNKSIKGETENEEMLDEVDDESYQAIANAVSEYVKTSSPGWDELINESDNEVIRHNSSLKSITSVQNENFMDPLVERNFDGIDLTFLGYASSIKKLTARRQSLIKFAVAKMIMKEELAQQAENEKS